jgi:hypothetical protein
VLLAGALAAALAGCGKSGRQSSSGGGPAKQLAPVQEQGAVSVATRNTTRLGGAEAAADAAAVARAVYPGLTAETRPKAVVVADENDWPAALAAASLASAPTGAPLLYSDAGSLPSVSRQTLEAMHPTGLATLGNTQVISIGERADLPSGLLVRSIPTTEAAAGAATIARLLATASGSPARQVIVLAADAPRALQMPAAALAAESGAPILFVTPSRMPAPTSALLRSLRHPAIYVVDAASVGAHTLALLGHYGHVTVVSGGQGEAADAVNNAIEVSRFTDGTFGWGVKEPGHGLVFANQTRTLDAPAAAPLSASGDYGPLLLLDRPDEIPAALAAYLGDIQPAYTSAPQFSPVRGVYNHGWLIGDESAISSVTQAELDSLLEISPRRQSPEEAAVTQAE